MSVFGKLTTEPQRGVLTYHDERESMSGWYCLDEGFGHAVMFKPLYGRLWELHCYFDSVSQFIPTPKKKRR